MSVYVGNLGTVEVDSNVVGQVKTFSFTEDAEALDITTLGLTTFTYKGGIGKTTGSVECLYDHGDASGQEAMTVGAEVSLALFPVDNASTYRSATISAVITGVSVEAGFDQVIPRTFTFTGGAATWETVA